MSKIAVVGKQTKKGHQSGHATKKYLSQGDVPSISLEQAARIPRAIGDEHAGKPTRPLDVAHAMKVQPSSGPFRGACGAAIAYGLTEGGCNADTISITDLGRRVIDTTVDEPDGLAARREAVLKPRVIREFLQKYDGAKLPREDVAAKVLEALNVPQDSVARTWQLITESAKYVRFLKDINGVQYVDLKNTQVGSSQPADDDKSERDYDATSDAAEAEPRRGVEPPAASAPPIRHSGSDPRERRVIVTHGKNREFIPQLKELLEFGQFQPVVSVERESVAKPIPDKVMDDMRSCGAAIIHVDADREVITQEGAKEIILSGNVLIEIGGAMALYGRRFILLVKDGIRLPSNLQGLYEVRYTGDKLDGDATLRLLKAFNEFKTVPVAKLG
jgi:predicted nucleotide-binding protein